MIRVLTCIVTEHNLWLVLLAATICILGCWTVVRLFHRALDSVGSQFFGWLFLAAVAAGTSIWCTHFIAMLAYEVGVPVEFDYYLTFVSLVLAMLGSATGLYVASQTNIRIAPYIGGSILGLSISAMHYTGMVAYRVTGIVSWDTEYLIASIVLAVVFSALACRTVARNYHRHSRLTASGLMSLAVISLHFTAMEAFQVTPLDVISGYTNPAALETLAFSIAVVASIIVSTGIATYAIDTNQRQMSYQKLQHLALTDSLTQLPNRTHFLDCLNREIAQSHHTGKNFGLISIDLDGFKEINDTHGHGVGDKVLMIIGDRFSNTFRDDEIVGRVGGDEFLAIVRNASKSKIENFLSRIRKDILADIRVDDCRLVVGACYGVSIFPDDGSSRETLINNADLALYRAKTELMADSCYFEPSMDEQQRRRRVLVTDLRRALDSRELELFYQPQVCLKTEQIKGYEALLRWTHPEWGPISPAEFIPLAEENGIIIRIGEWVLRKACQEAVNWPDNLKVAVNLSPVQFNHDTLTSTIADALAETGLSANRLELELTETAVIDHGERSQQLINQIKALGVGIALDDFGTGYSSLYTLQHFPFDKLKLDQSFIWNIETDNQARAIVRTVLDLGRVLNIPVLAEGVETEAQLNILKEEGCAKVQGYYFGKPSPTVSFAIESRARAVSAG